MVDEANPPSIDPGDEGSLVGAFRSILNKTLQSIDDMLPAKVIAYDRVKNLAQVQPMIMMGTTNGQKVSRAQIAEVPVFTLGAGGFLLSFPVKPGDLGWIKASDRDISLFMQGLTEEWPNTTRLHSFQDGMFFPDRLKQWTLNADDADRVVLQSEDGATRIAVGVGTVDITAATTTIHGTLHVTGSVQIDGNTHADGTIAADGEITGNGVQLSTHRHTSAAPGSPTSTPIP